MPVILDGKALADKICLDLKDRADKLKAAGITPRLTIVTSGDDAASKVYVRNKVRRAEEIGIEVSVDHYDELYFDDVAELYDWHPIICQMPISGDVTLDDLGFIIDEARYDVDGFVCLENVARLASGQKPQNYPCTPKGIIRLLAEYAIPLAGKSVCIIGRSNIVGRPLARMMEQAGATVTLCHSKTPDGFLAEVLAAVDIIVSATGVRKMVSSCYQFPYLNEQVFVDVGMNRDENGKLCGDIDPEIFKHCYAYTPVPGGVGPMTVAMLMENVIECYERYL